MWSPATSAASSKASTLLGRDGVASLLPRRRPATARHTILANLLQAPDGRRAALVARGLDPDTASGRAAQTAALATRHAKVQVGDGEALHDRFAREAIAAGFAPRAVLEVALPLLAQTPSATSHATDRRSPRLLDAMTGPDGVTKQASSFSRRDAVHRPRRGGGL
jgi:hypothetical protein